MALVGRNGSIDWLGLPRFDSAGCFSALLGEPGHGRWLIVPIADAVSVIRHYRGDTMILETVVETETGAACVIDFVTRREGISDLVRIVRGLRGTVAMRTELIVRFEYGSVVPWVSRLGKAGAKLSPAQTGFCSIPAFLFAEKISGPSASSTYRLIKKLRLRRAGHGPTTLRRRRCGSPMPWPKPKPSGRTGRRASSQQVNGRRP